MTNEEIARAAAATQQGARAGKRKAGQKVTSGFVQLVLLLKVNSILCYTNRKLTNHD